MNSMVYKAFLVRIIRFEWKALLFAGLSISLGIALATSVFLATKSVSVNFEKNLESAHTSGWVGPVIAYAPEAADTLKGFTRHVRFKTDVSNSGQSAVSYYFEGDETLEREISRLALVTNGLEFQTQAGQLKTLEDLTRSYNTNLQIMGFISLFIGFFIVHHVFSLLVAKHSANISIARALGVSLREIFFSFGAIAFGLGLFFSVFGALLGVFFGKFVSGFTQATVREIYKVAINPNSFSIDFSTSFVMCIVGTLVSVLGAAYPILKIRNAVSLTQVLRGAVWTQDFKLTKAFSLWSSIRLVILSSVIASSFFVPLVYRRLPIGGFVAALAALLLNLEVCRIVMKVLYSKSASLSHIKWFRNFRIFASPQNIVFVQVLSLGFSLSIGVKTMSESFKVSLSEWTRETLKADVWMRAGQGQKKAISSAALLTLNQFANRHQAKVDSLQTLSAQLMVGNEMPPVVLAGSQMDTQAQVAPLRVLSKNKTQTQYASMIFEQSRTCDGSRTNPCFAYASEALTIHHPSAQSGNVITLRVKGRIVFIQVVAIYQDFGNDQGTLLTDTSFFEKVLNVPVEPSIANIYFGSEKLKPEVAVNELKEMLVQNNSNDTTEVFTRQVLNSQVMQSFERTFRITDVLYIVCVGIALFSVFTCLKLQVLLRNREWNILWAAALSAQEIQKQIRNWAAYLSLLSALLSIVGSVLISLVLVYVVNYHSFGYRLVYGYSWFAFFIVATLAFVSGAMGGNLLSRSLPTQLGTRFLKVE